MPTTINPKKAVESAAPALNTSQYHTHSSALHWRQDLGRLCPSNSPIYDEPAFMLDCDRRREPTPPPSSPSCESGSPVHDEPAFMLSLLDFGRLRTLCLKDRKLCFEPKPSRLRQVMNIVPDESDSTPAKMPTLPTLQPRVSSELGSPVGCQAVFMLGCGRQTKLTPRQAAKASSIM
ncbi:hypothetical protein N7486_009949 [Penicillium sp. IBT 16267x]|nr:hypothetical protein N7486_009949 [Penicillium sp. IBT 16267x]